MHKLNYKAVAIDALNALIALSSARKRIIALESLMRRYVGFKLIVFHFFQLYVSKKRRIYIEQGVDAAYDLMGINS
ncbi:unnamed protein product [Gongylonema pulchrum]|uniref:Transposase n=1 Tax=Gongylonema pulchrum TaxID=637853 RepID=A0A183D1L2_9BILA|nr:unnamed protein product [Gongylonema pulchrum]